MSQICDNDFHVLFSTLGCKIKKKSGKIVATSFRTNGNIYNLYESTNSKSETSVCFMSQVEETRLWHRRLGHVNYDSLIKISKGQNVGNMPKLTKSDNSVCREYQEGKQARVSFKPKEYSSTKPLQLIHTNLCGPTRTKYLRNERYFMLFIDDYTRMAWVTFLQRKAEAFNRFNIFRKMVEKESNFKIKCLRSNKGGEYTSQEFVDYCEEHGLKRQYLASRTPQQNGVAERKNRIVKEMARIVLQDVHLSNTYWKEATHTTIYILNRVQLRVNTKFTPYELWYGRPANVGYLGIFGSKCYIKKDNENISNFESLCDEGIFLGYSTHSKAYKCYNKRFKRVIESANVKIDEMLSHEHKTEEVDNIVPSKTEQKLDIDQKYVIEQPPEEKSTQNTLVKIALKLSTKLLQKKLSSRSDYW